MSGSSTPVPPSTVGAFDPVYFVTVNNNTDTVYDEATRDALVANHDSSNHAIDVATTHDKFAELCAQHGLPFAPPARAPTSAMRLPRKGVTILLSVILWSCLNFSKVPVKADNNIQHWPLTATPSSSNLTTTSSSRNQTTTSSSSNLATTSSSSNSSSDAVLWFAHVGKAGGETIKAILEIGCRSRMNAERKRHCFAHLPKSRLSDRVRGYHHCGKTTRIGSYSLRNATGVLFSIRHPVDRVVSWYRQAHPGNCVKGRTLSTSCQTRRLMWKEPHGWLSRFFKCFPSPEALATEAAADEECVRLGLEALTGRVTIQQSSTAAHLYFNLRYYVDQTLGLYPDKEVLVVRTEHMWEDLTKLDIQLGGMGKFEGMEGYQYTHGSENFRTNSSIAPESALPMCCVLREEIEQYRDVILRSRNLDTIEKEETVLHAVQRCGVPSWDAFSRRCNQN